MCLPEGERDRERAMALEAVVFPQSQDPFGSGYGSVNTKDFYNYTLLAATYEQQHINKEEEQGGASISTFQPESNYPYGNWTSSSSSMLPHFNNELQETTTTDPSNTLDSLNTRPKRRRAKSRKNKEEIENQRMTHIVVERNRRKQMNEYLSVLRSLMPDSYIQRVLHFILTNLYAYFLACYKNKEVLLILFFYLFWFGWLVGEY